MCTPYSIDSSWQFPRSAPNATETQQKCDLSHKIALWRQTSSSPPLFENISLYRISIRPWQPTATIIPPAVNFNNINNPSLYDLPFHNKPFAPRCHQLPTHNRQIAGALSITSANETTKDHLCPELTTAMNTNTIESQLCVLKIAGRPIWSNRFIASGDTVLQVHMAALPSEVVTWIFKDVSHKGKQTSHIFYSGPQPRTEPV